MIVEWPRDSTCVVEAESGELDIIERKLGTLIISFQVVLLFKPEIMT